MQCAQCDEHSSTWSADQSIAPMICCTPQTLLDWVKRVEVDRSERVGVSTDERERIKVREHEALESHRANEILKTASGFSAQTELDRKLKS